MSSPSPSTRDKILDEAITMLAVDGAEGTSMRRLADRVGIKQPVIYYYFQSKHGLMLAVYHALGQRLGAAVRMLPATNSTPQLLRQRIAFHLEQAPLIMAMVNYFLLDKRREGELRIPPQAVRHIQDAIEQGIADGTYESRNPLRDASIIVHTLNGFMMEHFPNIAHHHDKELVEDIALFIERSLRRIA